MRIKDKTVISERGDFVLEYLTYDNEYSSHLILISGTHSDLTACGLQYSDFDSVTLANPNRCLRCLNSPFHKMRT